MAADAWSVTDGRTRRPLPRWVVEAPLPDDPQRRADALRQLRVWGGRHGWCWGEIVSARRLYAERAETTGGGG